MFLGLRARLFITMVKIFVFDPLREREHIYLHIHRGSVSELPAEVVGEKGIFLF